MSFLLPVDKGACHRLESRAPDDIDMCRKIFRVETFIQNTLHGLEGCRRAGNMPLAGIALDDCMIERATVGGIGIAVETIKRVELQDTPRVD